MDVKSDFLILFPHDPLKLEFIQNLLEIKDTVVELIEYILFK